MAAEFIVNIGGEDRKVTINDDRSITTDSDGLTALVEVAVELRPPAGYEPDPVGRLAEYLVEKMEGRDLKVDRPSFLDDPPGLIY